MEIKIQKEETFNIVSTTAGFQIRVTKDEHLLKIIFLRHGLPTPEFIISKESAEILKQMLEEALKI